MQTKEKVKVIAIIIICLTALGILGKLFSLVAVAFLQSSELFAGALASTGYFLTYLVLGNIIYIVISILILLSAIGVLMSKEKARIVLVWAIAINILIGIGNFTYALIQSGFSIFSTIYQLIVLGLWLYVLIYFSSKEVKATFKK